MMPEFIDRREGGGLFGLVPRADVADLSGQTKGSLRSSTSLISSGPYREASVKRGKPILRRWRSAAVLLPVIGQVVGPGCSRREPCAPARVTVDGAEMKMPLALGARVPSRLGGGYRVSLFNHTEVDCPAFLGASRMIVPNEIDVHAYVGSGVTNVGVNSSNELGRPVSLVREPQKVGDMVEMCVSDLVSHEIERNGGRHKVSVSGTISAKFCGDAE